MSLLETACPHCGKSMVFSPIDYINTEERPEMIQKVRDGEAFVSICGHCGKKSLLDNGDKNFVNPKEKLYDHFPLTVHQMDIIIGVLFALIALFLILGVTHTSFFGLFGG